MLFYPLFMNLKDRNVIVFGAGSVALRKIRDLLKSGALVDVVSCEFSKPVARLARKNRRLRLRPESSVHSLLKKTSLAFVATSDARYNQKMADLCRRRKIWVNVADQPALCDFIAPSSFKRGRLQVAVSTGGASPLLARKFRLELFRKLRPGAVQILNQMARLRRTAALQFATPKARKKFYESKIRPDFQFFRGREEDR